MRTPILLVAIAATLALPVAAQAAPSRHHPARVRIATYSPQPHKPLTHRVHTIRVPHRHLTRTSYHPQHVHNLHRGS